MLKLPAIPRSLAVCARKGIKINSCSINVITRVYIIMTGSQNMCKQERGPGGRGGGNNF